jgi:hypothetical protein
LGSLCDDSFSFNRNETGKQRQEQSAPSLTSTNAYQSEAGISGTFLHETFQRLKITISFAPSCAFCTLDIRKKMSLETTTCSPFSRRASETVIVEDAKMSEMNCTENAHQRLNSSK